MEKKLYIINFYDKTDGSLCFRLTGEYKLKRNAQKRLERINNAYHIAYDIKIDEEIPKKYFVEIYKNGNLILRVAETFYNLKKAEKKAGELKKDYSKYPVEIKIEKVK